MTALRSLFALVFLAACGGSVSGSDRDSGAADSGTTTPTNDAGTNPVDATTPDDAGTTTDSGVPFPAPHPAAPQVISYGGATLSSPTVIPVFYPGDPLQSKIEAMLQGLPQSNYWKAITADYNIG